MPPLFKLRPSLRVVEELSIKNHRYTSVFVGDRLLPVRQADDAEPPRTQYQTRALKVTFLVRATMKYRLRHPLDDAVLYLSVSG
jgi:hypothetical protein